MSTVTEEATLGLREARESLKRAEERLYTFMDLNPADFVSAGFLALSAQVTDCRAREERAQQILVELTKQKTAQNIADRDLPFNRSPINPSYAICKSNTDSLSSFWNSLPSIEPVGGSLTFTNTLSNFADFPNQLYIRNCYQEIFKIICDTVDYGISTGQLKGTSGFAITGTPGIGKSIFLFYMMWRLSRMDTVKAVVVHRAKDAPWIYVFSKSGCIQTDNYSSIYSFLTLKSTWYLTDTLPMGPSIVPAITIVVASPARGHYKEFIKYTTSAPLYYLPIWSLNELLLARCLHQLTEDQVRYFYSLIGGIPRFVLEKHKDIEKTIHEALGRLDIEKFRQIIDGVTAKENDFSHLIVHFDVSSDYLSYKLQFASEHVVEIVLDRFAKNENSKLRTFIANDWFA